MVIATLQSFLSDNAGDFLTGGFGAFFGAWAAYWLENKKVRSQEASAKRAAIIRGLMTLIYNINSLENLRRGLVVPYKDDPEAFTKIPYFYQIRNDSTLDVDSLAFLVEEADSNVPMALYVSGRVYVSAFDAVDKRNEALRDLQNSANCRGLNEDGTFTMEVDLIKHRLVHDTTRDMFRSILNALEKNQEAFQQLRKAGTTLFPGTRFPRWIPDSDEQKQVSSS